MLIQMQKMGTSPSLFIILYLYSISIYFKVWIFFLLEIKDKTFYLLMFLFFFFTICSSALTTLEVLTYSSSLSNSVLKQREWGQNGIQSLTGVQWQNKRQQTSYNTENPDQLSWKGETLSPQSLCNLHPWRSAACGSEQPDQRQSSPILSPGTESDNLPI